MYFHFPREQWSFKNPPLEHILYRLFFGIRKHEFPCPLLIRRRWLWIFSDRYTEQTYLAWFQSDSNEAEEIFYLSLEESKGKIKILGDIRWG